MATVIMSYQHNHNLAKGGLHAGKLILIKMIMDSDNRFIFMKVAKRVTGIRNVSFIIKVQHS